ncbi:hypothetical protein [Paraburkholderia sp. BR14320]|uniref:hypothetical protein n=1 Tax=unclassified Paraburkholderia TaxID=2615204 RepID=UPI0034CEBC32
MLARIDGGASAAFSVSGTIDGSPASGSASIVDAPPVITTLGGARVAESVETVTTTTNGVATTDTVEVFTNPTTGAEVTETRADGSTVSYPPYTDPPEVVPGDGGVLADGTIMTGNTPTGTQELSYEVGDDTSDAVVVTIEKKDRDNHGQQVRDEKRMYKVDKNGQSSLVSRSVDGEDDGHADELNEDAD